MELAVETASLAAHPPAAGPDHRALRATQLVSELDDAPPEVRGTVTRTPSCFRSFHQHPDDVAALIGRFAAGWPDRSRPVIVVGVRTSGSYLAPFAVASLRRAGFSDVTMVSARPDQWYLRSDARTLRAAARKAAVALVIDDPPASGNAVAGVRAGLMHFGIPQDAIIPALALFEDSSNPPEALSPFGSVTLPWAEGSRVQAVFRSLPLLRAGR
jgi:hypothetical protein